MYPAVILPPCSVHRKQPRQQSCMKHRAAIPFVAEKNNTFNVNGFIKNCNNALQIALAALISAFKILHVSAELFRILSGNLEKHAYELCCCTKHIFPGLRDGEFSFPSVDRELLHVVLETSLSSWSSLSRHNKSRGPEWETLSHSAIPQWRDWSFPKENGSIRVA